MQKNILKKIIYTYVFLSFSQTSFANDVINNLETRAKIENFCSIQANDINFGVVALPLTAQSANAQMRVLCTNNTPYKIDLKYGQYIGGSSNINGYSLSFLANPQDFYNTYSVNNDSGANIGNFSCGYGNYNNGTNYTGKVYFHSLNVAKIFGYASYSSWLIDTKKICTSDGTITGTYPTGWVGDYNASGSQPLGGVGYREFGSMSGAQKGDKLAYKVTLPDDSSKTWTKGFNSYSSTGIGTEQMISINAQMVPDKSSSKYVAQDIYLDNITAEITY